MTELDGSAGPAKGPITSGRRRRLWVVATVVLLAVGLAATWWFRWSAAVEWTGEGGFGISVPATAPGQPQSFGGIVLCARGIDEATVDDVTADGGGLTVTDFAVRPLPLSGLGSENQPLRDLGFGSGRTVTGRCDGTTGSELAVEVTRSGPETARTDGLTVSWSAGTRSGSARVPASLVLCASTDTTDPDCDPLP